MHVYTLQCEPDYKHYHIVVLDIFAAFTYQARRPKAGLYIENGKIFEEPGSCSSRLYIFQC